MNTQKPADILIVDDEVANLQVLVGLLDSQGYYTRTAINGSLALRAARATAPDLILLDIMMPDMDGYEVCAALKADAGLGDVPVVFLSALEETADKVQAFAVGGVDYITKPFQVEELLARVQTHLALRNAQKHLEQANAELVREIGERVQAESQRDVTLEALRKSEERYTMATRAARVSVWDWNMQTGEFYLDPNAKTILGYSDEEIPNALDTWVGYIHPDDRQAVTEAFQAHIEGQTPEYVSEHRMRHKDGSVRWFLVRGTAIRDAQGNAVRVVGTDADITERKRAEQLLGALNRAALAMAQALTHDEIFAAVGETFKELGLTCMILPIDESRTRLFTRYVTYGDRMLRVAQKLTGIRQKDLAFPIENVDVYGDVIWKRKTVYVSNTIEVMRQVLPGPAKRFAGQLVRLFKIPRSIATPLIVEGEVIGVLSVQSDDLAKEDMLAIAAFAHQMAAVWRKAQLYEQAQQEVTERKRAEEALRESEEKLQEIFSASPDAIIMADLNGDVIECNQATLDMHSIPARKDLIGKSTFDFFAPQDRHRVMEDMVRTLAQGSMRGTEYTFLTQGGREFPVELSASVIRDADGQPTAIVAIARDITERKRAAEALQQYTNHLEVLREVGLELAAQLDLDVLLHYVAARAIGLLNGSSGGVYLYRPKLDALEWAVGVDNTAPIGAILRQGEGLAGKVWESGKAMIVENYCHWEERATVYDEFDFASIVEAPIRWGDEFLGVLNVSGNPIHTFSEADADLLNLFAAQAAIAIVNARLYEQAQQDAETKALLLREVNHRVGNNLTSILGILALEMQRPQRESADLPTILQDLQNRIHGLSTIHNLLSAAQWSPLSLDELITKIIQSALSASPIRHKIEVSVRSLAEAVFVTPRQATNLALVFNELTTNSAKHAFVGRGQGRIDVQITTGQGNADYPDPGDVTLRFCDDGPGWPDDVLRGARENVGLNIIRMTVRGPLRGQLALSNADADSECPGAVASITFRLAPTGPQSPGG